MNFRCTGAGNVTWMLWRASTACASCVASVRLDRRALLVIAVSLALGLGVSQVPEFLVNLPTTLRHVMESGVATGGLCALLLNWFLPETENDLPPDHEQA